MMRLRSENVAISYCMKKYQEVSLQINILGDTKLVKSVRAEKTSVWWRQSVGGGEGTASCLGCYRLAPHGAVTSVATAANFM